MFRVYFQNESMLLRREFMTLKIIYIALFPKNKIIVKSLMMERYFMLYYQSVISLPLFNAFAKQPLNSIIQLTFHI